MKLSLTARLMLASSCAMLAMSVMADASPPCHELSPMVVSLVVEPCEDLVFWVAVS